MTPANSDARTTRSPIVATIATQFIRESVPQLCNSLLPICRDEVEKKFGLTRHDSAHDPIGFRNLVSNWCQTVPIVPVFPTQPVYNHLSVNNLVFFQFHGMEEVIGSIPIRSTNNPIKMNHFPDHFFFWRGEGAERC
jgi:hypothetical protein